MQKDFFYDKISSKVIGGVFHATIGLGEATHDLVKGSPGKWNVILKGNDRIPSSVPGKIAAYGNGVRHTIKGGTGSGEVNSRYFVSVEEGLRAAGFTITTNNWLDAYDKTLVQAKEQFVRDVKAAAKKKHTMALMECMGVGC